MQEVDEARPRRTQIGITFGRVGGLACSAELGIRIQSAGSPVNFICLFLAVLGLHCCTGFSLVMESGGYSLASVRGLLIAVASLVAEHGL